MVVRYRGLWSVALVGLAMLGSAQAADRPDDIVAVVISDSFGGKPGLFLEAVRSSAAAGGLAPWTCSAYRRAGVGLDAGKGEADRHQRVRQDFGG